MYVNTSHVLYVYLMRKNRKKTDLVPIRLTGYVKLQVHIQVRGLRMHVYAMMVDSRCLCLRLQHAQPPPPLGRPPSLALCDASCG